MPNRPSRRNEPESEIDIVPGRPYRVRLVRHVPPDYRHPEILYEGTTTFEVFDDVPYVKRLGKRWRIRAACYPQDVITGTIPGYRIGATEIEYGETHVLELLDRNDPRNPFGPDGPSAREALEMALDVFLVENRLTGIRWE
jgi:hypothetical protein